MAASSWKSGLIPVIRKVFDRSGKKAAAAEACKSFDQSKEEIAKELEEKKAELQPKVVEIYEASPIDIKTLVKNPTEAGTKKKSTAVVKFIEELVKIEFPGSEPVSEAAKKYGLGLVSGPAIFILQNVATLIPDDEPPVPATVDSIDKDMASEEIKINDLEAEKSGETEPTPPPPPAEEAPPASPAAPATKVADAAVEPMKA